MRIFETYFMAHKYMPKIFHDLHKPSGRSSNILNVWSLIMFHICLFYFGIIIFVFYPEAVEQRYSLKWRS